MTTYTLDESELQYLKDKVVLLTGCATGIGLETAKIAHAHGAHLVLGDWNQTLVEELANTLNANRSNSVVFRTTNTSNFDDFLELFQLGWKTFGKIHAVLSNAGINSNEGLFEDHIDPVARKLLPPDLKSIHVNLTAHIYAVKCAEHYFRKWPETKCQIVLTGSAASYLDTPPLYLYGAAKAGVLGLMRGARTQLIKQNISINMVAPWLTVTPLLLPSFMNIWGDLPTNQPGGVAQALLLPMVRPELNGKAFFVAGHQIVDFEETLKATQPSWMGKTLSDNINEGQRRLIP